MIIWKPLYDVFEAYDIHDFPDFLSSSHSRNFLLFSGRNIEGAALPDFYFMMCVGGNCLLSYEVSGGTESATEISFALLNE